MLVLSHLTFNLLVVFSCCHQTQSQAFLFFPFYILWILLSALHFSPAHFLWPISPLFVCLFVFAFFLSLIFLDTLCSTIHCPYVFMFFIDH